MVNIEAIIKLLRSWGYEEDWPEEALNFRDHLEDVKRGFPGIKNDHLTIVPVKEVVWKPGEIFIYDPGIFDYSQKEAPVMLRVLPTNEVYIEGIGFGMDYFDPDRTLRRWKDVIIIPGEFVKDPEWPVYRVDVKPNLNGGAGYYYFLRSFRDYRF